MLFKSLAIAATVLALAAPAPAETVEVQMLNKGADGEPMVFEPAFVHIAPGDTLQFVATDKSHNAESIDGMAPEGAASFTGKINEEVEITFDTEGFYGIKCKPHFAMGMVMVVKVGDADIPEDFLAGRIPPRAKQRFEAALEHASD